MKFALKTPVLFLIFNRLDTTKKVFAEIKKAKPKKLFIAADGPRAEEEKKKTDAVRKYILKNINWKCEVKTLFRDKNLGCKYAVSGAIDWFFENVEEGIILEDDCLPDQSFFRFCQEMLEKYRDDEGVMLISGANFEGEPDVKESYFFSKVLNVWGWATWRRAWDYYDVEMKDWKRYDSYSGIKKMGYEGILNRLKILRLFRLTFMGKIDTWDYQWAFSFRIKNALSITPKVNLVTNIGVGGGTHTTNLRDDYSFAHHRLTFPLAHPKEITENKDYFKVSTKKDCIDVFKKASKNNLIRLIKKIKHSQICRVGDCKYTGFEDSYKTSEESKK